MGFLERMGLKPEREIIQVSSLDDATRVALWNTTLRLLEMLFDRSGYREDLKDDLTRITWTRKFEQPADIYTQHSALTRMRSTILQEDWAKALDVIDWIARAGDAVRDGAGTAYAHAINQEFESYLVGYRFVDNRIISVSSEEEAKTIAQAISTTGSLAKTHLKRALDLLSSRNTPQYAKVISESISAVESVVGELTGEHVLSSGLKKLDASGVPIHKALGGAWDKLYGYTSDANGIRHALVREEDADEPLAVYFLVSCSAFINFLLKVSSKA